MTRVEYVRDGTHLPVHTARRPASSQHFREGAEKLTGKRPSSSRSASRYNSSRPSSAYSTSANHTPPNHLRTVKNCPVPRLSYGLDTMTGTYGLSTWEPWAPAGVPEEQEYVEEGLDSTSPKISGEAQNCVYDYSGSIRYSCSDLEDNIAAVYATFTPPYRDEVPYGFMVQKRRPYPSCPYPACPSNRNEGSRLKHFMTKAQILEEGSHLSGAADRKMGIQGMGCVHMQTGSYKAAFVQPKSGVSTMEGSRRPSARSSLKHVSEHSILTTKDSCTSMCPTPRRNRPNSCYALGRVEPAPLKPPNPSNTNLPPRSRPVSSFSVRDGGTKRSSTHHHRPSSAQVARPVSAAAVLTKTNLRASFEQVELPSRYSPAPPTSHATASIHTPTNQHLTQESSKESTGEGMPTENVKGSPGTSPLKAENSGGANLSTPLKKNEGKKVTPGGGDGGGGANLGLSDAKAVEGDITAGDLTPQASLPIMPSKAGTSLGKDRGSGGVERPKSGDVNGKKHGRRQYESVVRTQATYMDSRGERKTLKNPKLPQFLRDEDAYHPNCVTP